MQVTDVRFSIPPDGKRKNRLVAFCSIILDRMFLIRDIRIIQGDEGLFIAFPSRKATDRCPACDCTNSLDATYCNNCGRKLPPIKREEGSEVPLHKDVCHPINTEGRTLMQDAILKAFEIQVP